MTDKISDVEVEAALAAWWAADPGPTDTSYREAMRASLATRRAQSAVSVGLTMANDNVAAQWLRQWAKRKFGIWITWRTAWSAVKDMRQALNATQEGK